MFVRCVGEEREVWRRFDRRVIWVGRGKREGVMWRPGGGVRR